METTEQHPDPQAQIQPRIQTRPGTGTVPGADRLMDVPGMRNLRDAGGFATADGSRVALGLLYRSASLGELGPDGAARLAALKLRTVVDLRSAEEIAYWPNQQHGLGFSTALLPTLPTLMDLSANPDTAADEVEQARPAEPADAADGADATADSGMTSLYAFMAETAGPPIVACIRRLTDPDALPALIHCAVGKDRTGVTIAVILTALGVDGADIVADYTLSNAGIGLLDGPVYYLDEHGDQRRSHPVHEDLIVLFLERIKARHSTIEAFLQFHGLQPEELARLRQALLTTDGRTTDG
jgi:protein-tyrosine phosphatase